MKSFNLECLLFSLFFNLLLNSTSIHAQSYAQNSESLQNIVVLGDSLTAGYGVDKEDAFPSILQQLLHQNGFQNYRVINAGVSGSTTASGKSRLKWFLKSRPSILILALGANDGLRGLQLKQSQKNLEEIILEAKRLKIKVILGGMHVPTNYGEKYQTEFHQMYKTLQKKHKLILIPFLLEGVGGKKDLNIADGIHPNSKGHVIIAKNVYKYLEPQL